MRRGLLGRRRRRVGLAVLVLALGAWMVASPSRRDPDQVWARARADFEAGRYDRTEAALERLNRLRAPNALDRLLRSQLAGARGRTDEAVVELARVPDRDPLAPRARLLAGQLELRRDRLPAAEAALRNALALDPKLVQAHRELIFIYGMQLRRAALHAEFLALSQFSTLSFDNVFHWCLLRTSEWDPAEVAVDLARYLAADPGDRWSRLALAESLRRLGRLDEAEQTLAVLPESDPEARAGRALLALYRNDDRRADALLAEGPRDHPALARLRGQLALKRKDGAAALSHFRAACAAEPDNRDSLIGLGRALALVGDQAAAAPYLERARGHDLLATLIHRSATREGRQDKSLLNQLGAACAAIGLTPEARAWYKLAIARNPLDAQAQAALFRLDHAGSRQ
jgi:predicted Zn-dependent protease